MYVDVVLVSMDRRPDLIAFDGDIAAANGDLHPLEQIEKAREKQRQFAENKSTLDTWLKQGTTVVASLLASEHVAVPTNLDVLNVDVRIGARSTDAGDAAIPLLQSKLESAQTRLHKLIARINDTASRVLVTGDLNAGKSSLCNALLRRAILPVDQQPCTDVFCEVVDCNKNDGIEEVHAVTNTAAYSTRTADSFDVYSLSQLDELVHECDKYKLLVVYLRDFRSPEESLLANGVVDIRLIDAPGLNVNQVTTSELFGRQEEIDLVIFVVNAENHFTQSAQEFLKDTAQEKSLVFIAVNQFDKISDKDRCQQRILKQIETIAPETRKQSNDFVHFVSSNPPDAPPDNPFESKDLDKLDAKLRSFVLEKRSQTKLAPARTFLVNLMREVSSISNLSSVNASKQRNAVNSKLEEVAPLVDSLTSELDLASTNLEKECDSLVITVQTSSESRIKQAISSGSITLPQWTSVFSLFDYAYDVKQVLFKHVLETVTLCEDEARQKVSVQVDRTHKLGAQLVGDQPIFTKRFMPLALFSGKRDAEMHNVDIEFSVLDIIKLPKLSAFEKEASLALIPATGLFSAYQCLTYLSKVQPLTRFVKPSKQTVIALLGLAAAAVVAYTVQELPKTVPQTLARKLKETLDSKEYARVNAERIATGCRKVLKTPLSDVKSAFHVFINTKMQERVELEQQIRKLDAARLEFDNITERAVHLVRDGVQLDLAN